MNSQATPVNGFVVVYVTCGTLEHSQTIARTVVEKKLAACVNIVSGVQSIYCWENQIQDEPEYLLVIKTHQRVLSTLEAEIKALHAYTTPEFIATPIVHGSAEYLAWLDQALSENVH